MWPDNETEIDLLGFGDLVDSLHILLTSEQLLPLTVGVSGDWGSGKSSVMRQARQRLADENGDDYLTVWFSPWRYEDSEQVKVAFIQEVLRTIETYVGSIKNEEAAAAAAGMLAKAKGFFKKFRKLKWRTATGAGATLGLEALGSAAGAPGVGTVVGTGVANTIGQDNETSAEDEVPGEDPLEFIESIAEFHDAFQDLLGSLEAITAIVVFIDDMDRCEQNAIIDTFETIRLFLNAPKTAYVLGINEPVIVAALEERYPRRSADSANRAKQYVEKMIQQPVGIPALSQDDAKTYISLLYASKHLNSGLPAITIEGEDANLPDGSDPLSTLRKHADKVRLTHPGADAMNLAIAKEALGVESDQNVRLHADLEDALTTAGNIGGPVAAGLRGNPRQIKRFLNDLELRRALAEKREVKLRGEVLAKLMVLELLAVDAWAMLFSWQNQNQGLPPHIEVAQRLAAGDNAPAGTDADVLAAVEEWRKTEHVNDWLKSDPDLVGEPLGAYFAFSRNKLTVAGAASNLTPDQQQIFASLISTVEITQRAGVVKAREVEQDIPRYVEALLPLLDVAVLNSAAKSLIALADTHDVARKPLLERLRSANVARLNATFAFSAASALKKYPEASDLFEEWADNADTPSAVKSRLGGSSKKIADAKPKKGKS